MLIMIESSYGDKILRGEVIDVENLQKITDRLFEAVSERDFPSAFCNLCGYEEMQYRERISVDYIIDTDTHLLLKKYTDNHV